VLCERVKILNYCCVKKIAAAADEAEVDPVQVEQTLNCFISIQIILFEQGLES
jgi:hypothetical protein